MRKNGCYRCTVGFNGESFMKSDKLYFLQRLQVAVLFCAFAATFLTGAAEVDTNAKRLGDNARSRAFTERDLQWFKEFESDKSLSKQTRLDLGQIGSKQVTPVELPMPELESVRDRIQKNADFLRNETVGTGGRGKVAMVSYSFGTIGATRIGVVDYMFARHLQLNAYVIEESPLKWIVISCGRSVIDTFGDEGRHRDQDAPMTLFSFFETQKQPSKIRKFIYDGKIHVEILGLATSAPSTIPSRHPAFIFNEAGALVDWVDDEPKSSAFIAKWGSFTNATLITPEDAKKLMKDNTGNNGGKK